ncbi:cytochrome P450 (plasmid) [Streptosporangium sp. NBC_01495]|uniref:cytochrome P450 family protein n=1 Tax=Streptosporangium sp. NBC_01495 TaxID=2903899 RepID=UPI002E2F961C|nr:cytochrome P450 [Streptosporangium sp. NBC_01495]
MTRHTLLKRISTDARFAKNPRHWRLWASGQIPSNWPLISWVAVQNMLTADAPDHPRLRHLVDQAFTRPQVERLAPRITAITGELLRDMATGATHTGSGTSPVTDLKAALALPLPLTVISELFGVPDRQRERLQPLCRAVFDQSITPDQAQRAHEGLQHELAELVRHKRAEPGPDMTSALVAARDGDDRLTEPELIWTLILMIGAGYETTTNLITNAVRALLTHPDQLALITRGDATWAAAVEETLRLHPSIAALPFRYTRVPVRIAGITIPAGEAVLMCYAAAGRDPAQHGANADRFDLTRRQRRHLAFSHGPHHCLGAELARREATTALEMLFTRFPDLQLAPVTPPTWLPSIVATALASLPVVLGPRAAPATTIPAPAA